MKNRIIQTAIFWALFVLFIHIPSPGIAQVAKGPDKCTTVLDPEGTYDNILRDVPLYIQDVQGSQSHNSADALWLTMISGNFEFTGKSWKYQNIRFYLVKEGFDSQTYHGDVFLEKDFLNVPANFRLYRSFFKLIVVADIDVSGIQLGDTAKNTFSLGIAPNGLQPTYIDTKPQYLVYGKKEVGSTGINLVNFNQTVYPNPFVDQINFLNFKETDPIIITNNLGQTMYVGLTTNSIETSNWPSGLYFFKTKNSVHKLIKN